jgi:hypothetical protein
MVCPDDGAVDHLNRLTNALGVLQDIKQEIP